MRRGTLSRRPRGAILVALLLLTLVVAGGLTYQAHEAARSHRGAVEATLRDYAGFATWEYARRVQGGVVVALHQALHPLFEPGSHTVPRPSLPGLAELEAATDPAVGGCGGLDRIEAYFRLDLTTGDLATSGRPLPPAVASWVADTLMAEARAARLPPSSKESLVFGDVAGETWALGFTVPRRSDAAPPAQPAPPAPPAQPTSGQPASPESPAAYGLVTRAAAFGASCADIFPDTPLLPPSLTGGVPNDSILAVAVTTGSGATLCASPLQYASSFTVVDTLAPELGGLAVRVTLRPEAAGSLLIGGVPRSRLPLLLGLLLLTAGLITAALVQLRREYELARLREAFVSGVSHELRTPLAQIRMFAETLLLDRVRSDAERHRSLEIIDREARRLGQLVDNVLRFSGAARTRGRIAPEPTALTALVREVVEAFEPLARARGVRVRVELEPGVAAALDRGAFRQMLLNLLDNAVKYGPAGQTVTVALGSEDGKVRLRVDDQGPGIPRADRERVWGSFNRLERDVDAAVAGSGIGLAVVRELARLHGGDARIEDAPGGGARFVVELPDAWRRIDDDADAHDAGHPGDPATAADPGDAATAAVATAAARVADPASPAEGAA